MKLRKESIWIGTWNLRTLLKLGKLALMEKEFKRIKLDIVGLAETRWNKEGHFNSSEKNMIVYSGGEETGQRGVTLTLLLHC